MFTSNVEDKSAIRDGYTVYGDIKDFSRLDNIDGLEIDIANFVSVMKQFNKQEVPRLNKEKIRESLKLFSGNPIYHICKITNRLFDGYICDSTRSGVVSGLRIYGLFYVCAIYLVPRVFNLSADEVIDEFSASIIDDIPYYESTKNGTNSEWQPGTPAELMACVTRYNDFIFRAMEKGQFNMQEFKYATVEAVAALRVYLLNGLSDAEIAHAEDIYLRRIRRCAKETRKHNKN
jgi:hypothetical protein